MTYDDDGKARVTVTSAAGVPTGIVTLSVNGGPPLSQNLVNGSTTFILSAPEAGIYDLHAEFPAQGNYAASTADARLNVSQASTFVTIDAPTVTYNDDATVTVSVNAPAGVPTPMGTVTLTIDNDTTLSAALVNGGASFTFSGLTAGDHELHAAYALQGSYAGSTADALLHVNPAPTALFIDAPTVTYNSDGTVTLTVSPPDGVPVPTGTVTLRVDNENPISATLVNGNATFTLPSLDAGDHNLYADYSAQGNYASSAAVGNLHVNPAPLTVTVANVSKVYGTAEVEFSATVTGLLNGDAITTAFDSEGTHDDADVGIYDIMTALFAQGGTKLSNYDIHMQGGMVTVTPADLNVAANDNSKIYGQAASDTGTVTGVAGHDEITADFLSAGDALTANAGSYTITAALDVHQGKLSNYTVHFTDGTLTVNKADAAIAVRGYSGVYDGNVHSATGTATGVQGESLSGLDLGAGFIDAPGSTAYWTFTDQTGNYNDAYGSVEIIITKAMPGATINAVGPITYDGQAHGTTGAVVGVGGAVLSATVAYTDGKGNVVAAPVNAGTYTATVSYAGDNNYDAASASTTITIDRAAPKVSVVAGSFTYDGTPHPATGSVTGVGGSNLGSPLFTYSYTDDNGNVVTMNGAPVDPGYYTVTASFAGDENYTPASSTATLIIAYNAQSLTDLSRALNSGRTIPIKIRLTDAAGNNLSSSNIDLTAVRLERVNADGTKTQVSLQDAGNSNPGNLFRYDASLGGYIFNLSTKGLGAGAYNFFWTAEGDPTQHELSFKLA